MPDEQRAGGQYLSWAESVRADEGGAHATCYRGGDVAAEVVADE
jgi:hypothetical protein